MKHTQSIRERLGTHQGMVELTTKVWYTLQEIILMEIRIIIYLHSQKNFFIVKEHKSGYRLEMEPLKSGLFK